LGRRPATARRAKRKRKEEEEELGRKRGVWRVGLKEESREREIVRRFGVVLRTWTLNLCFLKKTQQKPMQERECIKHLVNSKFKCVLN
jgi:hypothetical protein